MNKQKRRTRSALFILAFIVIMAIIMLLALSMLSASKSSIATSDEIRFVKVDDIQIAYKEFGTGEPVILIMGFSGTMDLWDTEFLKELSSHYKVIIFDNRGMGNSASSAKNFSIELFADDTTEFMDALGIDHAHVIGWSLGTYISQELVLRHPEKVDKLVLYAGDCGGTETIMPTNEILTKLTDESGTAEERNLRMLDLLFPKKWLEEHPDPTEYFPNVTETSLPESINRQNQAWLDWEGTCSRLSKITQPTLLITGTEDVLTPPQNSEIMARLIPNSQLKMVTGGGHGLMYQDLGFAESVVEFLENS
ncbi:MAG: alpha/beta hydrolase [Candidatus Micrarchaeota archaeon]